MNFPLVTNVTMRSCGIWLKVLIAHMRVLNVSTGPLIKRLLIIQLFQWIKIIPPEKKTKTMPMNQMDVSLDILYWVR